ncbi:hypothetical protein Tco_0307294, partial [Tanacetum coccineum]
NVHDEAFTSQPKETVHTNTQPAANKVSLRFGDINIIPFKNSFDALEDQDDVFETNKSDWQKSSNSESTVNDSDSEDKALFEDHFNLYDILNKRKDCGDDLKYPPGFTPSGINMEEVNKNVKWPTSNEVHEHVNSTSNKVEESVPKEKLSSNNSGCSKRVHTGGSILQLMDKLV